MPPRIEPKVALLTQASNPIVAAVAIRMARRGTQVVACHCPEEGNTEPSVESDDHRSGITRFSGDLANMEDAEQLVALARERFGRIDILVNAPPLADSLPTARSESFAGAGTAGLQAWTNAVEAVAPALHSEGRIVSIVTSAGRYRSSYFVGEAEGRSAVADALAGGAILAMTRQLALELAPRRIRVNAVVTGVLEGSATLEHLTEAERRHTLEEISLGRLGTADEVAAVVQFLASEAANYITGEAIDVNGGWWMS